MERTLEELRREPHLSISAINSYMGCSLRFRLKYIAQVPPGFQPSNLVLGSAIHKVMETFYLAKQEQ